MLLGLPDPHPDPYQDVMDPQHWRWIFGLHSGSVYVILYTCTVGAPTHLYSTAGSPTGTHANRHGEKTWYGILVWRIFQFFAKFVRLKKRVVQVVSYIAIRSIHRSSLVKSGRPRTENENGNRKNPQFQYSSLQRADVFFFSELPNFVTEQFFNWTSSSRRTRGSCDVSPVQLNAYLYICQTQLRSDL